MTPSATSDVTLTAGTAETTALAGHASEMLVLDLYTASAGVRMAHGTTGVSAATGYPLIAGSRNTVCVAAGRVLAFSGPAGAVVSVTVLR